MNFVPDQSGYGRGLFEYQTGLTLRHRRTRRVYFDTVSQSYHTEGWKAPIKTWYNSYAELREDLWQYDWLHG